MNQSLHNLRSALHSSAMTAKKKVASGRGGWRPGAGRKPGFQDKAHGPSSSPPPRWGDLGAVGEGKSGCRSLRQSLAFTSVGRASGFMRRRSHWRGGTIKEPHSVADRRRILSREAWHAPSQTCAIGASWEALREPSIFTVIPPRFWQETLEKIRSLEYSTGLVRTIGSRRLLLPE